MKLKVFTNGILKDNQPGYGFYTECNDTSILGWGYTKKNITDDIDLELKAIEHSLDILSKYEGIEECEYHINNLTIFKQISKVRDLAHYRSVLDSKPKLPNSLAWLSLLEKIDSLRDTVRFSYSHLPMHNEIDNSQIADMLSARGICEYREREEEEFFTVEEIPTKKFKTPKGVKTPSLLCDALAFAYTDTDNVMDGKYVYFTGRGKINSGKTKVKKGDDSDNAKIKKYLYFTGNYSQLRYFGKPDPEDRYNVVLLNEPFEVLEKIKAKQTKICKGIYNLQQFVVYRLSEITTGHVMGLMENHGDKFIWEDQNNYGHLCALTKPQKEISVVMNPPGLAFKFKSIFEENYHRLVSILNGNLDKFEMSLSDITEEIYSNDEKGKLKLHDDFKQNTKTLKLSTVNPLDSQTIPVCMVCGIDIPARNAFNKWVKLNPKIQVASWRRTDREFHYAIVVTTDEGSMFWTAPYGSIHLLPKARKKK